MMHIHDRDLVPFTPRSALLFLLWIGLLMSPILYSRWKNRPQVPTGNLKGQWIGLVNITGGYKQYVGDTPGDHNKGAIRFTLTMYDGFLERYKGKGEFLIQGETKPRSLDIVDFGVDEKDGHVYGEMGDLWRNGDRYEDAASRSIHGWFKPDGITFIQEDSTGIQFRGVLHRGNDAEYQALCNRLPAEQ